MRDRRKPETCHTQRNAGFSLLELSIVILIFSSIAVMGLQLVSKMVTRKVYFTTQSQLMTLDTAMMKFYRVYGRLPCPADRTLAITNASYGNEGNCGGATSTVSGMIPFRAMNLPVNTVIDGYNNRINYVVSRELATTSTFTTAANIEVRSGNLQQPCSSSCTVLANPATGNGAAYVLFSNGEDKRGAVNMLGTTSFPCYSSTSDTRIDSQNCAAGALTIGISSTVYYDSRYNNGTQNANYFDDIIVWRTKGRLM